MNATATIPVAFERVYRNNSKYAFISCIHELTGYTNKLVPLIHKEQTTEVRHILHQMKGTAGLLLDDCICQQVMTIQRMVITKSEYQSTFDEIAKLERELHQLCQRVFLSYPFRKILAYGDNPEELTLLTFKLSTWNRNLETDLITSPDKLEELVASILPEVLIVVEKNQDDNQLANAIESISKNFLGTSIFCLKEQKDWQKLRGILETS